MKKINILFLGLILSLLVFSKNALSYSIFEDEPMTEMQEDEQYEFPLDNQPTNIFNKNENSLLNEIKESTVEYTEENATAKMGLTSETVDFYPETSQYVAKGNARVIVPEERLQMDANEIIIDQRNHELIGIGNVKIVKSGQEYFGDYIRINTKKESSFFSNPILFYSEITIDAKSAVVHANETIAKEGVAAIEKNANMLISTTRFGQMIPGKLFDKDKVFEEGKHDYKIVAKKLIVKREDQTNKITIKNATIYRGKHKIAYSPNFTLATDKDVNYLETTVPEIGSEKRIGRYVAPAWVFGLPNASTLKAGPLLAYKHSDVGLGAFARLNTPKSKTEFMYSSVTDNMLIDTKYDLADNWRINFTHNEHIDTGWMGGQLPNYGVELVHNKVVNVPQANLRWRNRFSVGLFDENEDYKRRYDLTTVRYMWQAEASNRKPLLNWEKYLMLGYAYQHAFSLYQTGERTGVVRFGPRIYSDLGRLYLELTYFASGQYNQSPFIFDRYRYGKNNVRFRGQYYINKYLSVGYYASANIDGRDYNDDWLTENQFVASVGTEDLKLRFGYDTIRQSSVVGLDMLLGSNKALVEFDEMKVVDFDKSSKNKDKKKDKKKKVKTRL